MSAIQIRILLALKPGPLRQLTEISSTRWARTATSSASKPGAERFDGRLKSEGGGVAAEQIYFERGLPNGIGGAVLVGKYLYGTVITGQSLVAVEFNTGKVKWKVESFGSCRTENAEGG